MRRQILLKLLLVISAVSFLLVCSSLPEEIEEGLTPMEYFQRAQEASDAGRYELAMAYYVKFQQQYPEERDRNIWAEYEIALLYDKMGDNQLALERLEALLAVYDSGEEPDLPEGPRILAEKVKNRIEKRLSVEQEPAEQ